MADRTARPTSTTVRATETVFIRPPERIASSAHVGFMDNNSNHEIGSVSLHQCVPPAPTAGWMTAVIHEPMSRVALTASERSCSHVE